jgi:hypothetical protein
MCLGQLNEIIFRVDVMDGPMPAGINVIKKGVIGAGAIHRIPKKVNTDVVTRMAGQLFNRDIPNNVIRKGQTHLTIVLGNRCPVLL